MPFISNSFRCPLCEDETKSSVLDSRIKPAYFRRRRVCGTCKSRYTTYEITEDRYKNLLQVESYFSKVNGIVSSFHLKGRDCANCVHYWKEKCDLNVPNAGGRAAEKCNKYKDESEDSTGELLA